MTYPISTTDLGAHIAEDDEHATMIVIEALASNTYDNLEIKEEIRRAELKQRVLSWDRYDEFCELISTQKQLLVSPLGLSHNQISELNEAEILDSTSIAGSVISTLDKAHQSQKRYRALAGIGVAASVLIAVLGFTTLTQSNDSSEAPVRNQAFVTTTQNLNKSAVKSSSEPLHDSTVAPEADSNADKDAVASESSGSSQWPLSSSGTDSVSPDQKTDEKPESGENLLINGLFALGGILLISGAAFALYRKIKR